MIKRLANDFEARTRGRKMKADSCIPKIILNGGNPMNG